MGIGKGLGHTHVSKEDVHTTLLFVKYMIAIVDRNIKVVSKMQPMR
jgi:hypothetical protein